MNEEDRDRARDHSLTYVTNGIEDRTYTWECRCGATGTETDDRDESWKEAHAHMEELGL